MVALRTTFSQFLDFGELVIESVELARMWQHEYTLAWTAVQSPLYRGPGVVVWRIWSGHQSALLSRVIHVRIWYCSSVYFQPVLNTLSA